MKTYTVEEIESMLEEQVWPSGEEATRELLEKTEAIISQLLAERKEIRKLAFEDAAEIARAFANNEDNLMDGTEHGKWLGLRIGGALRRKAKEE